MTRQWIREFGLSIDTGSETIDVSQLRGRFRVRLAVVQSPNSAEILVTNLSEATAQKIRKEGQKVSLTVGYQGGPSIAFTGNIIQKRVGRENPVDTYLAIVAQDGDIAYNFATVSKTLAAGSTFKDQVDVVLEAMKPHGVTKGYISDLGAKKMPRARTLFGMARDAMRDIAISAGANWTIQDGKLDVVKFGETKPGDVIVLNSQTGMIGRPVQTFEGVIARMLINPRVKPNALIKIDEASIDAAAFTPGIPGALGNSNLAKGIAADGLYKIVVVEHHGDTHGNAWYTEVICHRADGEGIYFNIASQNIVAEEVDGKAVAP
ncbi:MULTISPECIES: hypothetical protein [Hyphomicrobiales]|uniref:phage protein n=1 Tax=Methylobacterium sp. CCH7-A2 TaxID=1768789 RepID=UPI00083568E5|nr:MULTISPECIES: hypothetical protein [Hyphomicrobiales]